MATELEEVLHQSMLTLLDRVDSLVRQIQHLEYQNAVYAAFFDTQPVVKHRRKLVRLLVRVARFFAYVGRVA